MHKMGHNNIALSNSMGPDHYHNYMQELSFAVRIFIVLAWVCIGYRSTKWYETGLRSDLPQILLVSAPIGPKRNREILHLKATDALM